MKGYAVAFIIGEFPVSAALHCETDEEAAQCSDAIGAMIGLPVALFHNRQLLKHWPANHAGAPQTSEAKEAAN